MNDTKYNLTFLSDLLKVFASINMSLSLDQMTRILNLIQIINDENAPKEPEKTDATDKN